MGSYPNTTKEWLWRVIQLGLTSFVALGVYTLKVDRQKDIGEAIAAFERRTLDLFLTRQDFDMYKAAHKEWTSEVISRLDSKIDNLREQAVVNAKLLLDIHEKLNGRRTAAGPLDAGGPENAQTGGDQSNLPTVLDPAEIAKRSK